MDIVILLIVGLIVGFSSSFFGIGGGSLMIPILYALYPSLSTEQVIGISLSTICLNTAINNYLFLKQGIFPKLKIIIIFAISSVFGTSMGLSILHQMNKSTNKKVFAFILLITVLKILVFGKRVHHNEKLSDNSFIMVITSLLASFVSVITGLGGGVIYNPMLMVVAKMPIKFVTVYSNLGMFFAALMGSIPLLLDGQVQVSLGSHVIESAFIGKVNYIFVLLIFVSSVVSARIGVSFNSKVNSVKKKNILCLILVVLALKMLI